MTTLISTSSDTRRTGPIVVRSSRENVLRVTTRLARLHGLERFSISDVSSQLGISKSMVYDRFQSRAELVSEVLVEYYTALLRDAKAATRDTPKGIRRLVRILDMWLRDYVLQDGGCLLLRGTAECCGRADALVQDTMRFAVDAWRGCLREQLSDAAIRGEIPASADTRLLEFEIYGFVLGIQHDCMFLAEPVSFRFEAFPSMLARHGILLPPHAALRNFQ